MLNKQTNKAVAFLFGVLLLATFSCENQGSVDSLTEDNGINEQYGGNTQSDIQQNRSKLKTGPLTTIDGLTDEMKKILESHGLDPSNMNLNKSSETMYWQTGESSFNFTKEETEVGLRYMIDPCMEEEFTDIDCTGFPSPPPSTPGPINPVTVQAAYESFITPSDIIGYVQMGSWSATSQPIDYMEVVGISYRDYIQVAGYVDSGYNISFAGVALAVPKVGFPFSPEVRWEQYGQHYFEHNGNSYMGYSSKIVDF